MLCCLGLLLSLPATTSAVPGGPSALAGAKVGHVDRGANAPAPLPARPYPLTLAKESQETDKLPVNTSLLTTLVLVTITSFGASILWLLTTNARRRGAIRSWGVEDRPWLAAAPESPSFLGVFRL
jgi:hypothetical protein